MSKPSDRRPRTGRDDEIASARISGALADLCGAWLDTGRRVFFGTAHTVLSASEELLDRSCGRAASRRNDGQRPQDS